MLMSVTHDNINLKRKVSKIAVPGAAHPDREMAAGRRSPLEAPAFCSSGSALVFLFLSFLFLFEWS